ncbi:MAG: hypothetical protein RL376_1677, partial [Verrucomicrobiota bacterium]
MLAALPPLFAQQTIETYLTAKDTPHRLARQESQKMGKPEVLTESKNFIFVDPAKSFQTVLGIGAALTDAAAETYAKLPADKREEFMTAHFDPVKGIGYSLARTHIHSCDFSSSMYTYTAENDRELKTFSVSLDERFRLPFIRTAIAKAGGKLTTYVSPWSPPAWMKDNGNMLKGGKLLPEHRQTWANYISSFIKAYEKSGVPIWGLTVQNEPMAVQTWESSIYTAEEERDFVRDHLGPTLAKSGQAEKKIVTWDHNRTLMYERARVMLSDPAAAKYVWGVGFHWYMNDSFDNVRRVQEAYPETNLLMTEGCLYPFERSRLGEYQWGEQYGTHMIRDFNNGVVGWTDWNILLDERGGPNHVGNFCYAPVHADTNKGELIYLTSYYYIGHFSKFIRPGAKRIIASPTTDTLQTTAFKNVDGSIVVVVLNTTDKAESFAVNIGDQAAPRTSSPARSIITLI